ncbi:hypothetical protein Lal_00004265 [Lupinus albus]|nr:hypothetical protein Lal_00004259 [Lupinus albus]KAF1854908.1 hypothetical protein Lal_00004265 [Lupinus albus]
MGESILRDRKILFELMPSSDGVGYRKGISPVRPWNRIDRRKGVMVGKAVSLLHCPVRSRRPLKTHRSDLFALLVVLITASGLQGVQPLRSSYWRKDGPLETAAQAADSDSLSSNDLKKGGNLLFLYTRNNRLRTGADKGNPTV